MLKTHIPIFRYEAETSTTTTTYLYMAQPVLGMCYIIYREKTVIVLLQ